MRAFFIHPFLLKYGHTASWQRSLCTGLQNQLRRCDSGRGLKRLIASLKEYSISPDGKFIAFEMFGCWNCGGHQPEMLLYKLETETQKRIGKAKDFKWRTNGKYEYKEYIQIPCDFKGPGSGMCSKESEASLA